MTSSGSCASTAPPATATTSAAVARSAAIVPIRVSAQRRGAIEAIRRLHRLRAELHVVRPAKLLLVEVDLERRLELLAVPGKAAHELLVVGAALVPVGQERRGDVDAGAVPALRDHVDLLAGDLLVRLLGLLGVREVEVAGLAVHERIHPEPGAVLVDGD